MEKCLPVRARSSRTCLLALAAVLLAACGGGGGGGGGGDPQDGDSDPGDIQSLTVENAPLRLDEGGTGTVRVIANFENDTGSPSDGVTWTIESGDDFASIVGDPDGDTAEFEGLQFGTATAQVEFAGETETFDVTVGKLAVNPSSLVMSAGVSRQVEARVLFAGGEVIDVTGSDRLSWSTAEAEIADVDTDIEAGHAWVDAIAEGTTVIRAIWRNGTTQADSRMQASALVTVEPGSELTSLTVKPVDVTLEQGNSRKLRAFAPNSGTADEVTEDVTWSSNDESVATVDANNGTVTAEGAGQTKVIADNNGASPEATVRVVDPALGGAVGIAPFAVPNMVLVSETASAIWAQILFGDSAPGTVEGIEIDFSVAEGESDGFSSEDVTDPDGLARADLGPGSQTGRIIARTDAPPGEVNGGNEDAGITGTTTVEVFEDEEGVEDDEAVDGAQGFDRMFVATGSVTNDDTVVVDLFNASNRIFAFEEFLLVEEQDDGSEEPISLQQQSDLFDNRIRGGGQARFTVDQLSSDRDPESLKATITLTDERTSDDPTITSTFDVVFDDF